MRDLYAVLLAGAALIPALASPANASTIEELVLSDGTDLVTISVSETNAVKVTCNAGACGEITQANVGTKILSDGAHGEIGITHAFFGAGNNYIVNLTAMGGADTTLPTLMDLDQIDSQSSNSYGTLVTTFTDTNYDDLGPVLNLADSNVNDFQIENSIIDYSVFTDAGGAVPAATEIYTASLTGHSADNGSAGVDSLNPNTPSGSLTAQVILSFSGRGTIQANVAISDEAEVPEPGTLVLLIIALSSFTAVIVLRRFSSSSRVAIRGDAGVYWNQ